MDPLAALIEAYEASQDLDLSTWFERLDGLYEWLAKGGFEPANGVTLASVGAAREFVRDAMIVYLQNANVEIFPVGAPEAADPDSVFYNHDDDEPGEAGWYAWVALPGCLPDSDPFYIGESHWLAPLEAFETFGPSDDDDDTAIREALRVADPTR